MKAMDAKEQKALEVFFMLHGLDSTNHFPSGNDSAKDKFLLAAFLDYYEKNREKFDDKNVLEIAGEWYNKQRRLE